MKTREGKINPQSLHESDTLVAVSLLTVVFFAAMKFPPASTLRRCHKGETDLKTLQCARRDGLKKQTEAD